MPLSAAGHDARSGGGGVHRGRHSARDGESSARVRSRLSASARAALPSQASYVSEELLALHERAVAAGVPLLGEMGLDPGARLPEITRDYLGLHPGAGPTSAVERRPAASN